LIIFGIFAYANTINFILNDGGLIDKRAFTKINEIGNEAKTKLNVNIYLDVKGNNGIDTTLSMKEKIKLMKTKEKELIKDLQKPFVILAISLDQKYSNILFSDEFKSIVDKNDILDGYVIPLLAAKDKNLLQSKVSASALNGYAQIADVLADNKNIKLNSSIGSEGKTTGTIWKVFMYTVVLIGIIAYFFIILREKKYKAKNGK
jgi:hypothetical protein